MANIINVLEKEIEKGNTFMNCNGDTVSEEKLTYYNQKNYVALLKSGEIPFTKTFKEFHTECLEKFIPVSSVVKVIKDTIKYPNVSLEGKMDEPVEAENVAI